MAALGIGFAFLTNSEAILLDGLFSLVSFVMGFVSLRVATLVREPADEHYHFGYANFEPLINVIKGLIMAFLGVFAVYSAIEALFAGGRPIASGWALLYAFFGASVCLLIAWRQRRIASALGSPLVEVDAKGWLIDGLITSAVCVAFIAVVLMDGSTLDYLTPYADPVLVIALVVLSAPVPYTVVRGNLRELLMGAPDEDVQGAVKKLLAEQTAELPIDDVVLRMNKMGRSLYLHIYLLVAESRRNATLADIDAVRGEIISSLGERFPELSVDVVFTMERRWARLSTTAFSNMKKS